MGEQPDPGPCGVNRSMISSFMPASIPSFSEAGWSVGGFVGSDYGEAPSPIEVIGTIRIPGGSGMIRRVERRRFEGDSGVPRR